ncbi:MAG: GNAT family N-acetyltransferase [Anaerolineae bacterium]|nr:GNAT family N-acetyltransferase [Candidatus Roseilinea sp.]MDW8450025.1 GNAT family N-acetyltransferase [Anaerolineae bacterium]
MHLITPAGADEFLAHVQGALAAREVASNLMLGVALRLRAYPGVVEQRPYFAVVHDEGGLVAAALMTPPHSLIVHAERGDAQIGFTRIAHDLREHRCQMHGVIGPSDAADEFLSIWQKLTGATVKRTVRERVFQLERVIEPRWPPGEFRAAREDDVPLVAEWIAAFQCEALPDHHHPDPVEWAKRRIGEGDVFLWEDGGQPVSLAARSRETPNARAIGPVYTSPERRGRGYASAVTARLSQLILDSGKRYAMLFTDLSNPTSNSIYRKIGYKPVCDYNEYIFT